MNIAIIRNNSPINDIQLSTKELRNKHFLRHRNKIDWSLLRKIPQKCSNKNALSYFCLRKEMNGIIFRRIVK